MMKKGFALLFLTVICIFFLSLNAFADNSPFNKHTEAYYDVNFKWDGIENTVTDAFQRIMQIEILEPYFKMFADKTGISLEEDVFSWLGNRVQLGVVGTEDYSVIHNAIKVQVKFKKAVAELRETTDRMNYLRNAVEAYKLDKKKPPANLKELVPKYIQKVEKPIRGKHFTYRVQKDNQFEIKCPKDMFKDLGIKGENPSYHSTKGFKNRYADLKLEPRFKIKNILLVIDVRDSTKARNSFAKFEKILTKHFGSKKTQFKKQIWKKHIFHVNPVMSYTFYGRCVYIADKPYMLKSAIISMNKPGKNIYSNPVFQDFMKSNPKAGKYHEMLFVNLHKINLTPEMLNITQKGDLADIIRNLYYISYYFIQKPDGFEGDVVLNLKSDIKGNTVLKKLFTKTKKYKGNIMENLPGNLQMAVTYNLGEIWNLLEVIGEGSPKIASFMKMAQGQFEMATGADFAKDILGSTTGEIAVSYLARDMFISGVLESFRKIRERHSFKSKLKIEPKQLSPDKVVMKSIAKFSKIPMTFFIGVKDRDKLNQLMDKLKSNSNFQREYYKDVAIFKSNKIAYCFTDDLLIVHSFPSDIKIKSFIDELNIKRVRLGETTKYREFKKGIKGRAILIQYQDSEWAASMAKGFLLFLLPEFEDYAKKIGQYRESWTSLSITRRGIQLHFRAFREQGK